MLARSKVGTGKTLAFLVPTVEKIFKARKVDVEKCYDSAQQDWYTDPNHKILMDEDNYVSALVISPTRELAQAIGDECYRLTSYWYKMFRTTIIYGELHILQAHFNLYKYQSVQRHPIKIISIS